MGAEWETMDCRYVALHQAGKCQKSGESKKATALWSLNEVKDKGIDGYEPASVQKIFEQDPE